MKKLSSIIFLLILVCLTGCGSSADTPSAAMTFASTAHPDTLAGCEKFLILKETPDGIYFETQANMYYDKNTGKSIVLCNKPECTHDGNEFCTATNGKYRILDRVYYDDKILMYATEKTDTQVFFKLICASNDGARLEEIATVYALDNIANGAVLPERNNMYVHKNKVLLQLCYTIPNGEMDNIDNTGICIVDLDTKETLFLTPEAPLSEKRPTITGFDSHGDYIYFATLLDAKPKKRVLNRYNTSTGEIEELSLPGFSGIFAVIDDKSIAYTHTLASQLSLYDIETGAAKDLLRCRQHKVVQYDENGVTHIIDFETSYRPVNIACDGRYIYGATSGCLDSDPYYAFGHDSIYLPLYIYDLSLENEIATINLAEYMDPIGESAAKIGFRIDGDNAYLIQSLLNDSTYTYKVWKCTINSLVSDKPEFKLLLEIP